MNSNRLWIIGSVLIMVVVVVGTALVGISPQLDATSKANIEREAVRQQNAQLALDLEALKAQFADLDAIQDELDGLRLSIPDDIASEEFITLLAKLAKSSGANIKSTQFTEAALFVPSVELTESLDPALDVANFYTIPVVINAEGSADELLEFLKDLQETSRFYLTTDVTIQRGEDGVALTVTGFLFALRNADGTPDPETEEEEGAEPTPTPTETPAAPGSTPTPTETPAP